MKRVKLSMHNKCMGLWGNLKFSFFCMCMICNAKSRKKNFKIALSNTNTFYIATVVCLL